MLLDRIDVSKSSGPDKLPGRLLQSLAKEITPIVHFIFTQSLCTDELPTEWTQANVAPIFKKGSKFQHNLPWMNRNLKRLIRKKYKKYLLI